MNYFGALWITAFTVAAFNVNMVAAYYDFITRNQKEKN